MRAKNWLDFQKYAVWGAASSGLAAARLLSRLGKEVVLSDICSLSELKRRAEGLDVELVGDRNSIAGADVIVISPGLRPSLPVFKEAARLGVPVISEVQLAMAAYPGQWVGITGTDGKSTTTSLVGSILRASKTTHVVAGNIGTPLTEVVADLSEKHLVIAELSANQLWSCEELPVTVAAFTNFAPDHQDYFENEEQYWEAKCRLLRMQRPGGVAVLPVASDGRFALLKEELRREGRSLFGFGHEDLIRSHGSMEDYDELYFVNSQGQGIRLRNDNEEIWLQNFDDLFLIGTHNQLNCATAAAITTALGVGAMAIEAGLKSFRGLSHRMEVVATHQDLRFVNDSKATNPHASLAGIQGLSGDLVVIAGGLDKGLSLEDWAKEVAQRAQAVVLIGDLSDKLKKMLFRFGLRAQTAETLKEAVELAVERAKPGSTILLSPASSSYDMFTSYVHRGEEFRRLVEERINRLP